MKRLALGAALVVLTVPAVGQATSLQDVVSGKDAPLTLHLKDLGSDWKRVAIATQGSTGGMGDLMSQIMPLAMMGGSGPKSKDDMMGMAFMSSMFGGGNTGQPIYYTKGQTSAIGGETFLIAYKLEKPQVDFMQLIMESEKNGGKEPDMAKLMTGSKVTADSALSLSLVNVKSISTMSGIRAFDLAQELAESAKGPGGLLEMMMNHSALEAKTPATATPELSAPTPAAPAPARPKTPVRKGPGK